MEGITLVLGVLNEGGFQGRMWVSCHHGTEEGPQSLINVPNLWVEQLLDRESEITCVLRRKQNTRELYLGISSTRGN